MSARKISATFELRFVGGVACLDVIPVRAVSDAVSAVQRLALIRDQTDGGLPGEAAALVGLRVGSAVYACRTSEPVLLAKNLKRAGRAILPEATHRAREYLARLPFSPIKRLSELAKQFNCLVEICPPARGSHPWMSISANTFDNVAKQYLVEGNSSIAGTVERVGGATSNRCLLRVPGRRKLLYCTVSTRDLSRKLGQALYQDIVASGTATWVQHTWRLFSFKIDAFTQPKPGKLIDAFRHLHDAGGKVWDDIDDPDQHLREVIR